MGFTSMAQGPDLDIDSKYKEGEPDLSTVNSLTPVDKEAGMSRRDFLQWGLVLGGSVLFPEKAEAVVPLVIYGIAMAALELAGVAYATYATYKVVDFYYNENDQMYYPFRQGVQPSVGAELGVGITYHQMMKVKKAQSKIDTDIKVDTRIDTKEEECRNEKKIYSFNLNGEPLSLKEEACDVAFSPFSLLNIQGKTLATAKSIDVGSNDFKEGYVYFPNSFERGAGKKLYEVAHMYLQQKYGKQIHIKKSNPNQLTDAGAVMWQRYFKSGNAVNTNKGQFFVPDSEKYLFKQGNYLAYEKKYNVTVGNYILNYR